jgi:hypothetical protein
MTGSLKTPARRAEGRPMIRVARLLVLAALLAAPAPGSAEIYRWTDEQGVERFSDRIENVPERFRQDVTAELRSDPSGRPDPAPSAQVVPEEPPDAPVPDPDLSEEPPAQIPDWSAQLLQKGVGVVLAAALGGLLLYLLMMALALRLAVRVVGDEVPGFGRAFAVAAVQIVAGIVLGAVLGGVALAGVADPASGAFQGVQLLLGFVVNAFVVQAMLGLAFGRALVVAFVELLVTIAIGVAIGIAIFLLAGGLAATSAG